MMYGVFLVNVVVQLGMGQGMSCLVERGRVVEEPGWLRVFIGMVLSDKRWIFFFHFAFLAGPDFLFLLFILVLTKVCIYFGDF